MKLTKDGVWSVTGDKDWNGAYYLYEVEVFVPETGKVERNFVTDPYSVGLSANSERSLFVDLEDKSLAPDGWAELQKPTLRKPEDLSLLRAARPRLLHQRRLRPRRAPRHLQSFHRCRQQRNEAHTGTCGRRDERGPPAARQ